MSATKARRELSNLAKSGGNWRFKGLLLAHPDIPSGYNERDIAKAWPTQKSDYRFLSGAEDTAPSFAKDKHYSVDEDSDAHYQLSDAANESDWNEGPSGGQTIHADRAISRALAFEDSIANLDTLFRKELRDTVIEGARKAEVARDASTVFNVDRSKGEHPRGQDTVFAPDVAEGGAIRDDSEDMDTVSWDATKFGQGARVTDELSDQSLVDVIEQNIEWLGHSVEMKLNRVWLNELLDSVDTNNDVDASAEDNRGYAAVNEAIHQVELNDEMPDSVVQHPTFTKTLFDTAESNALIPFANEFGDDEGVRERVAFPLLGLTGYRSSDGVADGSTTWDYTAASEFGAVVYDQDRLGMYIYRDIEIKDYDDPVRDLQGVNARMQADVTWHQNSAGARIKHS